MGNEIGSLARILTVVFVHCEFYALSNAVDLEIRLFLSSIWIISISMDSLIIFGVHLKFEILLMILENSVLLGSFILLGLFDEFY